MMATIEAARIRRERTRRERFITDLERSLAHERARLAELQARCEHPDRQWADAPCPDCGLTLAG